MREIRNSLEKEGFEPLCFYLKCLDDDSEIEDLIKREIDAREWFVFVNSENSRKSKWVTLEREYIESTDRKKILTVDLDDDIDVSNIIQKITHNLRVFISYSHRDEELARRIKDKLEEKDYLVFFPPDSIPSGVLFYEALMNAIVEASQEGCVMVLLTQAAMESPWVAREVERAILNDGVVVPVAVGNVKLTDEFNFYLNRNHIYTLSENPTDAEIDQMIDRLGYNVLKK